MSWSGLTAALQGRRRDPELEGREGTGNIFFAVTSTPPLLRMKPGTSAYGFCQPGRVFRLPPIPEYPTGLLTCHLCSQGLLCDPLFLPPPWVALSSIPFPLTWLIALLLSPGISPYPQTVTR